MQHITNVMHWPHPFDLDLDIFRFTLFSFFFSFHITFCLPVLSQFMSHKCFTDRIKPIDNEVFCYSLLISVMKLTLLNVLFATASAAVCLFGWFQIFCFFLYLSLPLSLHLSSHSQFVVIKLSNLLTFLLFSFNE